MPSYAVAMPSGATNGQAVLIGTGATTLHTAIASTTAADEVWIWVSNYHATAAADLTITIGGVAFLFVNIAAKSGTQLVIPGIRVNNGGVVAATSSIASVLSAVTNVNRITF